MVVSWWMACFTAVELDALRVPQILRLPEAGTLLGVGLSAAVSVTVKLTLD